MAKSTGAHAVGVQTFTQVCVVKFFFWLICERFATLRSKLTAPSKKVSVV